MPNIKDRSNEFISIISSIRKLKKINPVYPTTNYNNGSTLTTIPITFTDNATKIKEEISRITTILPSLTEIQPSSQRIDQIKKEISSLQQQITHLQQREVPLTPYQNTIIIQLQTELAEFSHNFSLILEKKQAKLRNERQRREEFSVAPNILAHSSSLKALTSNNKEHSSFDFSSSYDPNHQQSSSTSSLLQISQLREDHQPFIDQSNRSEALQGIETTINDLGHIYQRLATMISEQGEQVQRIDMNINEMHYNVQRGQGQLLKYLTRMKNNRLLMIKMFIALFVFIILFSFIKSVT